MKAANWITAIVQKGSGDGKKFGFPTVNLNPRLIEGETGVYATKVIFQEQEYVGALYFGPRLIAKEEKIVLEIHILDFSKDIYGQEIKFRLGKYIRPVLRLTNDTYKHQLDIDIEQIRQSYA